MNIQLLLSASPSQGNGMSASQATGAQSLSSNGLFRQAMLQANEGQPRLPQELATGGATAAHTSPPVEQLTAWLDAMGIELDQAGLAEFMSALKEFASLLDSMDIELDKDSLAELFAKLQSAEQPSANQLASLPGSIAESSTSALDEISNRLALVATFSDTPARPDISKADSLSIAEVAEQLAVSQQDATVLVAAYQQLTASTGSIGAQPRLETFHQHIALLVAANSPSGHQQPASYSTLTTSAGQIDTSQLRLSSDAVASALIVSSGTGDAPARLGSTNDLAFNLPSASTNSAQSPIAAPSTTALPSAIGTPVSHPAWPSQLGQQLVQFAQRGGEQHIQMKLHPAELGPLSISLKMTEHGAQAHFLSAHAQVRQVLEQAIPQLRDALAEQGISLGETSVGEQNASNEQAFAQQGNGGGGLIDGNDVESNGPTATLDSTPVTLDGRVDLYA